MKKKPNQKNGIIACLRVYGDITAIDALNAIGCRNLPARIHELRRDGWGIKTEMFTTEITKKRVARYTLTDPAQTEPTGIPQAGRIQSLNVSVAAGVLLFEAMRQRASAEVPT